MSGAQTFYNTVIVLATLLLAAILYYAHEVVIVLFISILFASAIRPLVDILVRVVRLRVLAVLLIYLGLLVSLAALFIVSVPPFIGLAVEFVQGGKAVQAAQRLGEWLSRFGSERFDVVVPTVQLPGQLQALMEQVGETAQGVALPATLGTLLGIGELAVVLIMALYWVTAREPMLQLVLRLSPSRHRAQVELIWTDVEKTLGAYLGGNVILMVTVGAFSLVGFLALGVPYAPALAVIGAVSAGIPMVGPFIGAIPTCIVGFSVSSQTGILVTLWYFIVQEVAANFLLPKVMEKSVGLHPLLVIIALFVGATLNGIIGALIAVPIAGAVQVIAQSLLIEPTMQNNASGPEGTRVISDKEDSTGTAADGERNALSAP